MKLKLAALLMTTLLAGASFAGIEEAQKAFDGAEYEKALQELDSLVKEGNPVANYLMGQMLQNGLGIDADAAQAIKYYEAADQGYHSKATVELAKMIMAGEGTTENKDLGIEYLKKAAYAGNPEALYELGKVYAKGNGVEINDVYAFGFYYMAALKGEKRSQLNVAERYLEGRGIPQDFDAASKWYIRSANQGFLPAQQRWADLRASHPRLLNPLDAYSWYTIIAAYNTGSDRDDAAQKRDALGKKFERQVITAQQKKIKEWRPVPAKYSVPAAERQNAIQPVIPGFNDEETVKTRLETGGSLHEDGSVYGITSPMIKDAIDNGNKVELEKAVQSSIDLGKVQVYGYYGDLLRNRFKDDKSAVAWYQKGADAGDAYATYQLGKSYCEGRGVDPDIGTCYGWLLLARDISDKTLGLTVKNALDAIETSITVEEKQKGENLIKEKTVTQTKEKTSSKKTGTFNLF